MNILPSISHEIITQCKKQGVTLSMSLVTLYIRTQLLVTGKKDLTGNVELRPDLVDRIISEAVSKLSKDNDVMVETLNFQSSIVELQHQQVNAFRTYKVQHKAKSLQYIEDVCSKKDPKEVFMSIALYVLHESNLLEESEASAPPVSTGVSSSSDISKKETIAALESVLPMSQFDSFIAQTNSEKCRQLEEIWRIIWGIRLFNKETQLGGSDIPSLLEHIPTELTSVISEILHLKNKIEELTNDYSVVLRSPSIQMSDAQRMHLRDEYQHFLQIYLYLRSLVDTLHTLIHKVEEHEGKWKASIDQTSVLVSGSEESPVPKSEIYPKFIALSEQWDNIAVLNRDVSNLIEVYNFILDAADLVKSTIKSQDVTNAVTSLADERKPNIQLLSSEIKSMSNSSRDGRAMEYLPGDEHQKSNNKNERIHFEFNGFCVVSFVDTGVLLEGRKAHHDQPDMNFGRFIAHSTDTSYSDEVSRKSAELCPGYIHLHDNNAYYSFSSERCLRSFTKDPSRYLSHSLMEILGRNPVCVNIMGLDKYLPSEVYLPGTRTHEVTEMVQQEEGTQTGQIDPYKDPSYVFSEWELRRRAIHLANLRNKRTKSTQTDLSHYRRDNDTQAYLPKEQTTQTMLDAAIQPPIVRQYLKGLRGTQTSEIETVQKVFLY
eukprot:Tbor_TRINITY_DN3283_c0_g1::TRINITY_DN3283_c0_g1_i1::g.23746::m.23746